MKIIHEFVDCPKCGLQIELYEKDFEENNVKCWQCGYLIWFKYADVYSEEF